MKRKVVLDSSVWIELLRSGPLAGLCEKERASASTIFVPTVVFFEVYRKIALQVSEDRALSVVAVMAQNQVVDLSRDIALLAADLSIANKLAMADSLVLAHALHEEATLITLDHDFSGIDGAVVLKKR